MESIAYRLKLWCFENGLKQNEVAKKIKINEQQFNNWCNGAKITITGLQKLAINYSELDIKWLLIGYEKAEHNGCIKLDELKRMRMEIDELKKKVIRDEEVIYSRSKMTSKRDKRGAKEPIGDKIDNYEGV